MCARFPDFGSMAPPDVSPKLASHPAPAAHKLVAGLFWFK
jgi:hypothetical protein